MTTQEFSNEFDTLLNSHSQSSSNSIVLDEYEKSVLLTQAQEEIVKNLYNGNLAGESFEKTEELRRYLDVLVKTEELTASDEVPNGPVLSNNSYLFKLPEDLLFITYEQAILGEMGSLRTVKVVPIKQDTWHSIKENPFKGPNNNRVIRLDYGSNMIELAAYGDIISSYRIRYISKPTPIILVKLDDLSINGEHNITECKLNTALHRDILERAVQLAYRRFPQASK